jgi:hypothetical protein
MSLELRRYVLCAKLFSSAANEDARAHYRALAETYRWFVDGDVARSSVS